MEGISELLLPDDAITFIKLQRSNCRKNDIKKLFNDHMQEEFNNMLPFLPEKCDSIFDIGCGIGGIDILLSQHFNYPRLYLFDKDDVSNKVQYGFHERESFYNSLDVLDEIMKMNKIKNYFILNVEKGFPEIKDIDIFISLYALGFHFPLFYYFSKIFNGLSDDGIFICDLRKNIESEQKQFETLQLYFDDVKEIKIDNPKVMRVCARRPVCQA